MRAINSVIAFVESASSPPPVPWKTTLLTLGYVSGLADGRDEKPYDDGDMAPHRLTVCVPDAGSSLFAIGYRNGYLEGMRARYSSTQ